MQHFFDPGSRRGGRGRGRSAAVFAWKGESLEEYWWCTEQSLTWPDGSGPDLIVDDGGDATLFVHWGVKVEKDSPLLDRRTTTGNSGSSSIASKESVRRSPGRWTAAAASIRGVSEETTTGVHRLYQMQAEVVPALPRDQRQRLRDQVQVRQPHGCRESLADGIKRATGIMVRQESRRLRLSGDVGKGCVQSMRGFGAQVIVTEIDSTPALQAAMEGYPVVPLDDVVSEGDIFITATGCCDVLTGAHMERMKDEAIVCNIGHFDSEIDMHYLENTPGCVRENIKPQVDRWTLKSGRSIIVLAEGRLVNLGRAQGHPSFVMSNSFTNQCLAQIWLAGEKPALGVHTLPKKLDEEVARLHLGRIGARLTKLTEKRGILWDSRRRAVQARSLPVLRQRGRLLKGGRFPIRIRKKIGFLQQGPGRLQILIFNHDPNLAQSVRRKRIDGENVAALENAIDPVAFQKALMMSASVSPQTRRTSISFVSSALMGSFRFRPFSPALSHINPRRRSPAR